MGKHDKNEKFKSSKSSRNTRDSRETRNFLKVVLVLIVIAIIGVFIYMINLDRKENINVNTTADNTQQNKLEIEQGKIQEDEKVNEEEPIVAEENNEPEEEPENNANEQVDNNTDDEVTSIGDEDKAIELAKQQYGTTDGVYFRIEQIVSNGVYEVSVRDEETTVEYAWYTVDVKNGTVK